MIFFSCKGDKHTFKRNKTRCVQKALSFLQSQMWAPGTQQQAERSAPPSRSKVCLTISTFLSLPWGGNFLLKTKTRFAEYQTVCVHLKEENKETGRGCLWQVVTRGWGGGGRYFLTKEQLCGTPGVGASADTGWESAPGTHLHQVL